MLEVLDLKRLSALMLSGVMAVSLTACSDDPIVLPTNADGDIVKKNCRDDDDSCVSFDFFENVVITNPNANFPNELALAFKQLGLGDGDAAKDTLQAHVSADNPEETYAYSLASLMVAFDSIGGLVGLLSAPGMSGLAPLASDLRPTLTQFVGPIREELEDIESAVALIINAADDPKLVVPSLPINLDPSVFSDDLPSDLEFNLKGEWDRVEVHLLGAASTGIVALVDFLLSHDLSVNIGDLTGLLDVESTGGIAEILIDNPTFLVLDDANLLKGDVKDRLMVVLDRLVGEANGGPGGAGLLATIEEELASGDDQDDEIIAFNDVDGDGKASRDDVITINVIKQLAQQVDEVDPTDADLEVPLGRPAWVGLTDLGRALNANIAGGAGADPVVLNDFVSNGSDLLWEELQQFAEDEGAPELEELVFQIGVDPGQFFTTPKGPRNLFPAVTTTYVVEPPATEGGNPRKTTIYDFAFECEIGYTAEQFELDEDGEPVDSDGLAADSTIRGICAHSFDSGEMLLKSIFFTNSPTEVSNEEDQPDFDHFMFAAAASAPEDSDSLDDLIATTPQELTMPVQLELVFADGLGTDDTEVLADGWAPTAPSAENEEPHDDILLSLLLQDPSLAGALYLDVSGEGSVAEANQQAVNDFAAKLWVTYGDNILDLVEEAEDAVNGE